MTTLSDAQRLLRQGRFAEAERACEAVLEHSPDDIEALNVVALAALRDSNAAKAAALLERATRIDPANPVSFHHLGRAHEAHGNLQAALASIAEALRLRPTFYLSRLHYAALLERSGASERSRIQFARALRDAQSQGQWINAESTPAGLRPLVEHAVRTYRAGRRAMLFAVTERLAERFGRSSMTRVEKCLRIYLGEEASASPIRGSSRASCTFPICPRARI